VSAKKGPEKSPASRKAWDLQKRRLLSPVDLDRRERSGHRGDVELERGVSSLVRTRQPSGLRLREKGNLILYRKNHLPREGGGQRKVLS